MQLSLLTIFSTSLVLAAAFAFIGAVIINFASVYLQKERSHRHKLRVLTAAHEKTLLESRMEIQENTRQHISREIHDNIGLSLSLTKLYLNSISWNELNEAKSQVHDAINTLTRSIADLRSVAWTLNADVITSQGLLAAVTEELNRIERLGIFTIEHLVIGESFHFPSQQDLIIFRVIQESLNNIIRHSCASRVILKMEYTTDSLVIRIKDDGVGFKANDNSKRTSAGLANMRERMKLIGAEIKITSAPGYGTTIQLKIPSKNGTQYPSYQSSPGG
ncbi:MAG: sensor histidine kinase [Chitinophagaceae bacterium]